MTTPITAGSESNITCVSGPEVGAQASQASNPSAASSMNSESPATSSQAPSFCSRLGSAVKNVLWDGPVGIFKYVINIITCGYLFAQETEGSEVRPETGASLSEQLNTLAVFTTPEGSDLSSGEKLHVICQMCSIDVTSIAADEKGTLAASIIRYFNEHITEDMKDIVYGAVFASIPEGDERIGWENAGSRVLAEDPFAQAPLLTALLMEYSSIESLSNAEAENEPSKIQNVVDFIRLVIPINPNTDILINVVRGYLQGDSDLLRYARGYITPTLFGDRREMAYTRQVAQLEALIASNQNEGEIE